MNQKEYVELKEKFTREDLTSFIQNPCWKHIKGMLTDKKIDMYAVLTAENTRVAKVKSKADKIAIIDEVLKEENEMIKIYTEGN